MSCCCARVDATPHTQYDQYILQTGDNRVSGITKTIPATTGVITLNSLYDGSLSVYEFHMAGKPSKLDVGDYVYTIFADELHGRMKISRIQGGGVHPKSGRPRTLIHVIAPGERLTQTIPHKGHRGTRYYDGADWPTNP